MKFLVLLSIVSVAGAVPLPEGEEAPVAVEAEAPAALPYVHDATGDVAEAYVHEDIPAVDEEIAAVPYVHDATGDVAEPYVHEDIPAEVYTHEEPVVGGAVSPVTYTVAAHPTAGVIPIASYAGVYAGHAITYPYAAYPYAVYHTPTG